MERSLRVIREGIAKGEISPVFILNELLERIEKLDPTIRSYVTLNPKARGEASLAEKAVRENKKLGPLHGIPVSVKDLMDTAGLRTTYGNGLYASNVPEKNAVVVDNLVYAGAYVLGKTNTHEFALGMESPPTVNPYDITRIPGGSSGGSAAALASSMSVFALGSDTGGSIRIPASMCGITGLKPTYGIIPTDGVFPESWSMDHVGPMVKFTEDIPLVMAAMGHDISGKRPKLPIKAGIVTDSLESADPAVSKTVERAINELSSSGIIEVSYLRSEIFEKSARLHEIIDTAEIATVHRERYPARREAFMKTSIEQIEAGLSRSAVDYIAAMRYRDILYSQLLQEMNGIKILITPTLPRTAPTIAEVNNMDLGDHGPFVTYQSEFNYLGMPALSVPCGFISGLPVGLQIIAPRMGDDLAVFVGEEYQKISDWHLKSPSF